jgi:hypothetical protein
MSHEALDGHGAAAIVDISDAEWQQLQADDAKGGRAVICLMGGIFVMGIILYTIVCLSIIF